MSSGITFVLYHNRYDLMHMTDILTAHFRSECFPEGLDTSFKTIKVSVFEFSEVCVSQVILQ